MHKKIITGILAIMAAMVLALMLFIGYQYAHISVAAETIIQGEEYYFGEPKILYTEGKEYVDHDVFTGDAGTYSIAYLSSNLKFKRYRISVIACSQKDEENLSVAVGDSYQLEVNDGFKHTYSSSDPEAFTVDTKGQITALKEDSSATITETINDYLHNTYSVSSPPISVSLKNSQMYAGEKQTINVSGYAGRTKWDIDTDAVEVDGDALTAVSAGTAVVQGDFGGNIHTVTVEILPDPVMENISIHTDETAQISTQNLIDDEVKYTVKDTGIAEVAGSIVTAKAAGQTELIGYIHKKEFSCTITVTDQDGESVQSSEAAEGPGSDGISNDTDETDEFVSTPTAITINKKYKVKQGESVNIEFQDYSGNIDIDADEEIVSYKINSDNNVKIIAKETGFTTVKLNASGYVINAEIEITDGTAVVTRDQWLETVKEWCDYMVADGDWIYSNSNNRKNVDLAIKESHTTNCALMVVHAMQRAGVLPKGCSFYSGDNHEKKGSKKSWDEIYKHADVIEVGGVTAKEAGVEPGDICMWNGHVNIFAGYNKNGKQTWYDAGSPMTVNHKHGGLFENFYRVGNRTKPLYTIIRLHYIESDDE